MANWSYFKPEFAGRLKEDVEAHLLHMNDWMVTHNIPNDVKGQRFCLTLVGEPGLWYESLTPIENNWPALQESFRRQYSKIGNTREQLFHAWRSFHYDENSETVDTYVNRIRQIASMLGYGELQNLEVFKNTISNRLYMLTHTKPMLWLLTMEVQDNPWIGTLPHRNKVLIFQIITIMRTWVILRMWNMKPTPP